MATATERESTLEAEDKRLAVIWAAIPTEDELDARDATPAWGLELAVSGLFLAGIGLLAWVTAEILR